MATGSGRPGFFWRRPARAAVVSIITVLALLPRVQADAGSYTTIDGSGSSWSSVALFQWAKDVQPQGLTVNYNPDGSAQGRQDYMQGGLVHFAGSDPPFRNGQDKLGGTGAEVPRWGYSYVPDTAGGTAFMYHITVHGQLVRNLRLTPQVLMEIFTGQIKNWSDHRITSVYGGQLPNEPITPVLRADGSGATFFFTRWMASMFPGPWNAFCQQVKGVRPPCGQTEFYPNFPGSKSETGSIAVADYITASYGEGSIGYDEYAYALSANYPVVQLLNPAGYYVGPTASNVAVALTRAQINENPSDPNFLQQNLDRVYSFTDPRSYPLSSYSYLIVPRLGSKPQPPFFNANAGRSLSTFIDYFLCAGQRKSAELGYSPLPLNLVQGGLLQADNIPGHVPGPNLRTLAGCSNPTFTNGVLTLLKYAPYPSPCQKVGAPLNCVVKNGHAAVASGGGTSSSGAGSSSHGGTSSSNGSGSGNPASGTGANGTGSTAGAANLTGTVVNVANNGTDRVLLAVLTALAVVAAVATPPVVGAWVRRRKRQAGA